MSLHEAGGPSSIWKRLNTTFIHRWQTSDLIPELCLGASVLLIGVQHLSSGISEDHVLELEPVDGIFSTTVVIEASIWSMLLVSHIMASRQAEYGLLRPGPFWGFGIPGPVEGAPVLPRSPLSPYNHYYGAYLPQTDLKYGPCFVACFQQRSDLHLEAHILQYHRISLGVQ